MIQPALSSEITTVYVQLYTNDFKDDRCQSNLYVMLKQLLLFHKFYDFFCTRHALMKRPCYNNLFQITQHNNFQNFLFIRGYICEYIIRSKNRAIKLNSRCHGHSMNL